MRFNQQCNTHITPPLYAHPTLSSQQFQQLTGFTFLDPHLHSSTHTHTITPLSNVVVIEVGTRGCTNRWAHMLLGRFIRLSRQHSGHACLDTLCVCVWECVCVCVLPLSTGQVRSRSASSHSWSRTDPAPLGHATPSSPIHPLTYTDTHTNTPPSPSQSMKVGWTQGSCYPPYVSQQQGSAPLQYFVF